MTLALHNLKSYAGARRAKKRIGRGNASGHGTTATRGTKGQRARQGGRKGLIKLGVKHFVARLPKIKGFQSFKVKPQAVSLSSLTKVSAGAVINARWLQQQGLITDARRPVKIIGRANKLPANLVFQVQAITAGARSDIEAAGGRIEILPLPQ